LNVCIIIRDIYKNNLIIIEEVVKKDFCITEKRRLANKQREDVWEGIVPTK